MKSDVGVVWLLVYGVICGMCCVACTYARCIRGALCSNKYKVHC